MEASPAAFVRHPGKDFTRKRKLPFDAVVKLIISMGGSSIYKELLEAAGCSLETATTSAFVQQRDKILPNAFDFLFHAFTDTCTEVKRCRGYRLLAVDGSSLPVSATPDDDDTYVGQGFGGSGYYALHLNAMYDLCSRIYVDALVQPEKRMNETRATADMIDRSAIGGNVIVMADRNYESYNIFARAEKKAGII